MIGLEEALERVRAHVGPMEAEEVPLGKALYRVLAGEVRARVSSPGADVSLKDGYALRAADTEGADVRGPVVLPVAGRCYAGEGGTSELRPRTCVKVTTGAVIPAGADAVVGDEYCEVDREGVRLRGPVSTGLNILPRGTDIAAGAVVGRPGERLGPGMIGWLAAAGVDRVAVHRRPRVSLVATGSEVVAPGGVLGPGQIYASNLVTLSAWLRGFGVPVVSRVVPDRPEALRKAFREALREADVLLTSGGAWGSEKDLVVGVLAEMGWREIFHRVRLGPGKAVGFGLLDGRPVFCLPGGPPSNEMAFLQIALPGILRMGGWLGPAFPRLRARLTEPVKGRQIDWTQIKRGELDQDEAGIFRVTPCEQKSRLASMARAECLIRLPEGVERLEAGAWVTVEILAPPSALFGRSQ